LLVRVMQTVLFPWWSWCSAKQTGIIYWPAATFESGAASGLVSCDCVAAADWTRAGARLMQQVRLAVADH